MCLVDLCIVVTAQRDCRTCDVISTAVMGTVDTAEPMQTDTSAAAASGPKKQKVDRLLEGRDAPWVEKYRPKTLDDVAAHKEIIDTSEQHAKPALLLRSAVVSQLMLRTAAQSRSSRMRTGYHTCFCMGLLALAKHPQSWR